MGVIPLSDASRRPAFPVMTASLIAVNALVFLLELIRGETFVTTCSVIPQPGLPLRRPAGAALAAASQRSIKDFAVFDRRAVSTNNARAVTTIVTTV